MIRRRLTFANVASAIALFVAISGGTAVALNGQNTVQSDDLGPGAQVKNQDLAAGSVTRSKLKVPAKFTSAGLAVSPGNPCTSGNYWFNDDTTVSNAASYYRDPSGMVYVRGDVHKCGQANGTIFTLPPGYRPLRIENQFAKTVNPGDSPNTTTTVTIRSDGTVVGGGSFGTVAQVWLDGIVFRCGPAGQNGCP